MKETGIVRRIDDLGRVVIPKEIRRTMRIREGDPLEIFTNSDDEVVFKRYSPVGGISSIAQSYAEALFQSTDLPVLITDCDRVLACAGLPEEAMVGRRIDYALEAIIKSSTDFAAEPDSDHLYPLGTPEHEAAVACPIVGNGNPDGCILLLMNDAREMPTQTELALAQVAASFLGHLLDA